MATRSHKLSEGLIVAAPLLLVVLAPFTKVEESFSLHAVRDILALGFDPARLPSYDHIEFPGAVPRSFIGPILLAGATYPLLALGKMAELWEEGLAVQMLVRAVLSLFSSLSLIFLSRRVRAAFGSNVARYTLLITATQFHVTFWMSRTLPNMFAFPLVQLAFGFLIAPSPRHAKNSSPPDILLAYSLLTFAAIVMRLELAALIVPLALDSLIRKTISLHALIAVGVVVGGASQALTVGVDSHFWGRTLWPEGASILYNVVEGHASDWGVMPWHYYFTRSLPKILHVSLPFALLSMFIDRRARRIGYPSLAFIALLSILKHKEWRFFVYVVPALNVCAAAGVQSVQVLFSKRLRRIAIRLVIFANLALGALALYPSIHNYPGGQASQYLYFQLQAVGKPTPFIHVDSHSAMTGFSRFLHPFEATPSWYMSPLPLNAAGKPPRLATYSKSEDPDLDLLQFQYIVTSKQDGEDFMPFDWKVLQGFQEFVRYRLEWDGGWPIKAEFRESVRLLRRRWFGAGVKEW
ncbi:Alg9-like mannosyltransferase family-domain-containing protein [Leucosporidium creatinivorum]|uniref:Mannosyltransferase n=1 Tax=Leucosporidium creatinivorum TaxID=106004 RepID=A0A1Y2FYD5_9BASI|nr:Alg9-like mannosyltransferase family-domain-containing protein [Leucosporidium creatinivorum]